MNIRLIAFQTPRVHTIFMPWQARGAMAMEARDFRLLWLSPALLWGRIHIFEGSCVCVCGTLQLH